MAAGAGGSGGAGDGGDPAVTGSGGGDGEGVEKPGSEKPGKLAKMLLRSCCNCRRCAGDSMAPPNGQGSLPAAQLRP